MKSLSLYNQDGSLCSEARLLLSGKPNDMSIKEWRKTFKEFKCLLTPADFKEFKQLKAKAANANWRSENPEKVKESNANWRSENPEKAKESNANWKTKNPRYFTEWKAANHEKRRVENLPSYLNNYHKQRRAKDPLYRLHHNMRSMGNRVVKQLSLGKKPACTEKWQGCTAEELKTYLESLFQEGMTWDNYGKNGWHIDHIRPVSSFKPEEWEQINHYTNLQPLWAKDNLSKSNKY